MNTLAMPVTPTLAAFGSGSSYPASPRPDRSPSFSTQGQSKASSSNSNLLPYMKNQRSSSTRRMPSSESSLYDPYRSRQPAVSANRVKNEYQAHSPIRETYTAYPPSIYNYYSRHGSSDEVHELRPHSREGGTLTEEGFVMVPPPSIGQKEDHYRQSPTLTASQTLAANYGTHSESPYQTYLPYQPYSSQHALPSPSMNDVYRANSSLPSPGLGPLHTAHPSEERSEYKADPYRSAYSQSSNNHHNNSHNHPYGSPYQGSGSGSPNPNDFSSSFESKFSAVSSQQQSNGSSNNTRYPTRDLAGQDSSQALSTSFQETDSSLTLQQQQPQPQPQQQNRATTASSETAGPSPDKDVDNASDYTRPSTIHPSQSSKTDSSDTKKAKNEEEEEENEVILQKLGVLTAESNASRSGKTYNSGRSRRKSQWTDESDLENQERRARNRRRLGLERARRRNGQSFSSTQLPVTTANRIQESFDIQLLIDSTNNYVPIKVNALNINIILRPDKVKIADDYGFSPSLTIQPRVAQVFSIPMMLDYRSKYGSNDTLQDLIEVCTPVDISSNATIPGMNITIRGVFRVWGLSWVWRPSFALDANNVPCPVNSKASNNGSTSTSSTTTGANITSVTQGPIETTAAMTVNLAVDTAT
ncbi:hypothetical protein BGZ80_011024 [Entomortierella chlamydospora]|uniref:Uncharacterized protein n=1 Tax=Entomortierella chlamydospora TaxID=101097 RepID=A0A9P6MUG7_9FUNG|nr:hypothetical protein BGZ80_011024 [Entomortierella chlamydospora]